MWTIVYKIKYEILDKDTGKYKIYKLLYEIFLNKYQNYYNILDGQ